MKFRHVSCPDYEVTANVYQDIIVTIPPFHFFVVKLGQVERTLILLWDSLETILVETGMIIVCMMGKQ